LPFIACIAFCARDVLESRGQFADAGVFFLTISGGEIFLRPDLFDILEHARRLMFSVKIKTNAKGEYQAIGVRSSKRRYQRFDHAQIGVLGGDARPVDLHQSGRAVLVFPCPVRVLDNDREFIVSRRRNRMAPALPHRYLSRPYRPREFHCVPVLQTERLEAADREAAGDRRTPARTLAWYVEATTPAKPVGALRLELVYVLGHQFLLLPTLRT
jgi:hypothetical protein